MIPVEKIKGLKVSKVWGYEIIIVNREYCGKILFIKKGYMTSMHYHKNKNETFFVLQGRGRVILFDRLNGMKLNRGSILNINKNNLHRILASEGTDFVIMEFSSHHDDDDSIRIEKGGKHVNKRI